MTRSDQINELATALAKAQGEIEGAKKDADNPFFKSKYADLAAVREACQMPLSKNGLSIVQGLRLVSAGDGLWIVECETMLMHASGQWLAETLAVPTMKSDPQGVGSASTYARRYSLMAMVGVAAEDDDGQASATSSPAPRKPAAPKSEPMVATVKVLGIVQRPTFTSPGAALQFVISADDKRTYLTTQKAHAEAAKSAQQAGIPIEVKYRLEPFGRSVISIAEAGAEAPPL